MHLVDVATGMQLKSTGQGEKCVPFLIKKTKMTLYKSRASAAPIDGVVAKQMRTVGGVRYREPVKRVLRRLHTTPAATVTAPPPAAVADDLA